jgi:hypothetical protein
LDSAYKHGISDDGKYRHAAEKEALELRLAALENIVKSCKELVEKIY